MTAAGHVDWVQRQSQQIQHVDHMVHRTCGRVAQSRVPRSASCILPIKMALQYLAQRYRTWRKVLPGGRWQCKTCISPSNIALGESAG
eukprot:COSAG02_NODE_214_length_28689_cov_34.895523_18_plen_88_part_00